MDGSLVSKVPAVMVRRFVTLEGPDEMEKRRGRRAARAELAPSDTPVQKRPTLEAKDT